MTYSESARGVSITYDRCLTELERHGITRAQDVENFHYECWCEWNTGKHIDAKHVVEWLGY
jgi:hypothetical protein